MLRNLCILFMVWFILAILPGCSAGKMPCPTYADSQPPQKHKGKPGSQKPQIPKATKAKSGVLPPGMK